jgi:hypothetical protein
MFFIIRTIVQNSSVQQVLNPCILPMLDHWIGSQIQYYYKPFFTMVSLFLLIFLYYKHIGTVLLISNHWIRRPGVMVLQNTFYSNITFCIDFSISQTYKPGRKKPFFQVLKLGKPQKCNWFGHPYSNQESNYEKITIHKHINNSR